MLFDLKGKRRRLVQATYLTLAVLMGGGLVLFGIGGDVSGGLFDAFSERGGSSDTSSETRKRVERAETKLKTQPNDVQALTEVIRGNFQLATNEVDQNTGAIKAEGQDELRKADQAWSRYLDARKGEPEPSIALLMLQVYGQGALNQPEKGVQVAEALTEVRPNAQSYLTLADLATQAGNTRLAKLAGQKAIEVAPRAQKRAVRAQVKALSQPPAPEGESGTTTGTESE